MPYLADIDVVIWLVIIVASIIAQVIKGAKKVKDNAPKGQKSARSQPEERRQPYANSPQRPKPAATYRDRADELKQFLERLAAPVQESPPQRKPTKRKEQTVSAPAQTITPLATSPSLAAQTIAPAAMAAPPHVSSAQQARALRKALQDPNSQRKAVLMREILGPPLALR